MGDCTECPLPEGHPVHAVSLPETPYAGTSGWSGSQTSRERAEGEDAEGVTSERQQTVLALLRGAGFEGMTWREVVQAEPKWHHGQASGALSTLHKTGHIARLAKERRQRCSVYVLPEFVLDRPTAEQGRAAADPDVVKREVYRVVAMRNPAGFRDGETGDMDDRATAATLARNRGGRVQRCTIIRTPWEDVDG